MVKCKESEAKGEGRTDRKEKEKEQPRQEQCTAVGSSYGLRATAAVLYCYGIMDIGLGDAMLCYASLLHPSHLHPFLAFDHTPLSF